MSSQPEASRNAGTQDGQGGVDDLLLDGGIEFLVVAVELVSMLHRDVTRRSRPSPQTEDDYVGPQRRMHRSRRTGRFAAVKPPTSRRGKG